MNDNTKLALPVDSQERKNTPIARGVLDYFPAALAAVAQLSKAGNDKHNPGKDLHWARGKSMDHADCIARHLIDRGTIDPEDNIRHSAKLAWRALALLQEELEAAGAPLPRGARESFAAHLASSADQPLMWAHDNDDELRELDGLSLPVPGCECALCRDVRRGNL